MRPPPAVAVCAARPVRYATSSSPTCTSSRSPFSTRGTSRAPLPAKAEVLRTPFELRKGEAGCGPARTLYIACRRHLRPWRFRLACGLRGDEFAAPDWAAGSRWLLARRRGRHATPATSSNKAHLSERTVIAVVAVVAAKNRRKAKGNCISRNRSSLRAEVPRRSNAPPRRDRRRRSSPTRGRFRGC